MKEETPEDGLGKSEAMRGSRDEGENRRSGYTIFVIGQWSFVIGHLNREMRTEKSTNDQFFSVGYVALAVPSSLTTLAG